MTNKAKCGTHPDAEVLSAFAEQALPEKERSEVIAHLSACGRCRQVVALASKAAEVEESRTIGARPRGWWRGWGLAVAPAAAVAATAIVAVYVHQRTVERNENVAQIERRPANEKPPAMTQGPGQSQTPAAAPESAPPAAPRVAPAETRRKERAAVRSPEHLVEPDAAAAPPAIPTNGMLDTHDEPAGAFGFERHRAYEDAAAPPQPEPDAARQTQAAALNEEQKRRAEKSLDKQMLRTELLPPDGEHESGGSAENPAQTNSVSVEFSAAQLETRPAAPARSLQLHGLSPMMNVPLRPHGLQLPSGRPAVSVASANHRMIAIDDKGSLFLSEGSGETWKPIEQQWTGRAVVVRKCPSEIDASGSAGAPENAQVAPAAGEVPHSDTVFELMNDQGQIWVSVDGRIWVAK